jgi:hypothetical protein
VVAASDELLRHSEGKEFERINRRWNFVNISIDRHLLLLL